MTDFGTRFCNQFVTARYADGAWAPPVMTPLAPLSLHPAAHVLHYASTCFEGFKAYRWEDGSVRIFRLRDHVARMQQSARSLVLPVPDADTLSQMVIDLVAAHQTEVPEPPGSLYLRPTLIGTTCNIGAAAAGADEALLFVLASPVGDYFDGGMRPLKILVEDQRSRSTEQLGSTKTGGNYAAALGPTLEAKRRYGVDQVLFCPGGDVQETGAANFLLIDDQRVITKALDTSFLHGITRDSVLTLARELGYQVEERDIHVDELLERIGTMEATLSGTAAVMSSVGTLVYRGEERVVRNGDLGENTLRLRQALLDIQWGRAPDTHGWLTRVPG